MKVEELRFGNLVQTQYGIRQIKSINVHEVALVPKDFGNDSAVNKLSEINPIPLTDDILLKLGFELKNQWFDYELDGLRIGYITNDEFFQFEAAQVIDIRYVHQLQNLHFALTGKELVYSS